MGSYDGAETCELIGVYILSFIAPKFKDEVGLYRDDGIAVCKAMPREIEKTEQEVSNVFKCNGLRITIEANKMIVNFLDVTFDLSSGSYKPCMKPNNKLLYVHQLSNHPPALLKNIPQKTSINGYPTFHLPNKSLMKLSPHTNKCLKKVATTSSLNSIHKRGGQ